VTSSTSIPAARDVGGHQHVDLAGAERAERLLAGALAQVAVDGAGGEPPQSQLVGHLGRGPLGAGEDHGQATALRLEQAGEHLDLVQCVRAVDDLLDRLERRALVVGVGGPDVRRLDHVAAGHGHDGARHGRGEEHGVARGLRRAEQPLDVRQEPEVQHLVGLVQHDGGHPRQVQETLVHQVDHATGRPDDHLGAPGKGLDLRLVRPPAVDLHDAHGHVGGSRREVAGNLGGKLTGRHDDERLRLAGGRQLVEAGRVRPHDVLEDGDGEAKGLAGPGLGLADDVVPGECDRKGHRLDRERVGDPHLDEGFDDLGAHAEVGEARDGDGGGGGGLGGRRGPEIRERRGVREYGHGSPLVGSRGATRQRHDSVVPGTGRTAERGPAADRRSRHPGADHGRRGRDDRSTVEHPPSYRDLPG